MLIILISILSGMIGGFGVGGGVVLIPFLMFFTSISQQSAQSVNLCYFIPTAIVAVIVHFKNRQIALKEALILSASGVPFALLFSYLATKVNSASLRTWFGVFLIIVAIFEFFKKEKNGSSS